jgi:hypothetical protein
VCTHTHYHHQRNTFFKENLACLASIGPEIKPQYCQKKQKENLMTQVKSYIFNAKQSISGVKMFVQRKKMQGK